MKRRQLRVAASDAGRSLAELLAEGLSLPASDARRLVQRGAIYVDGRRCREPDRALKAHQVLLAVLEEGGRSTLEERGTPRLSVLFEDEHLVAIDKPAGTPSQPTMGRTGDSAADLLERRLGRPVASVHRLDRDTSGVLVFGKSAHAGGALAEQFRKGEVRKRYLAACGPNLPERGTIALAIARDPSHVGRHRAVTSGGRPARTDYVRLHAGADFCLVALHPKTGRTHQLRAHLKAVGAPILGDALYGGASEASGIRAGRTLLHAQAIEVTHPATGERLFIEAEVPDDLRAFFAFAGVSPPRDRFR